MTIPNNLPNIPVNKTDSYFNNYYKNLPFIDTNSQAVLISFFEGITVDNETAKVMAGSLVQIVQQQNLDMNKILDDLRKLSKKNIDAYLTLLFNMNRVNSSFLGVINVPTTSDYVTRTISL